jgi:hypothetical protein
VSELPPQPTQYTQDRHLQAQHTLATPPGAMCAPTRAPRPAPATKLLWRRVAEDCAAEELPRPLLLTVYRRQLTPTLVGSYEILQISPKFRISKIHIFPRRAPLNFL